VKVRLLTWFNGSGLSRDARVVGELLRGRGYTVVERNFFGGRWFPGPTGLPL
jgi:hypothetical protein